MEPPLADRATDDDPVEHPSPLVWEAFDRAPAFVAVLRGPEHVFEYVNRSYRQLVGFRDILGVVVREVLPELEGQGFFKLLDQVRATGEPFVGTELPITLQREPGGPLDVRFVDFVYHPLGRDDGAASGVLVHGVDVTDRVEAVRTQREDAEELRVLSRRLVGVQEQERRALALELHDEIGQVLTALKFTLEAAHLSPAGAPGLIEEAKTIVQGLQEQVRTLSLDLRPSMLDDFGLVPALEWLFERVERQMGLVVRFAPRGPIPVLPPDVATGAFRIVQEALTNVGRHAGVTEATVDLRVEGARLVLELDVGDHGLGFDGASVDASSSGLSGMRERAHLLGGTVTVGPRPGGGTCVRARLPLAP